MYLVLLQRAETVLRFQEGQRYQMLLWMVKLGIYFMLPLAVFSPVVFHGQRYFTNRSCVQGVVPSVSGIFMFSDTVLSLALLFLFIKPVMNKLDGSLGSDEINSESKVYVANQRLMRKIAVINLKFSCVSILSTFIFLTVMMVSTYYLDTYGTPENAWMRHMQAMLIPFELFLNTGSILLISAGAWMPYSLCRILGIANQRCPDMGSGVTLESSGHFDSNAVAYDPRFSVNEEMTFTHYSP
jgi:hypothetical protein